MKKRIKLEEAIGSPFVGYCFPLFRDDPEILLVFEAGYVEMGKNLDLLEDYDGGDLVEAGVLSGEEYDKAKAEHQAARARSQEEAEKSEYLRLRAKFEG